MNSLVIAGLGIKDLKQMTIETFEQVLSASVVLYLGCDSKNHLPELKKMGVGKIESILELYVDGAVDEENYQRLEQYVINATQTHTKTVLLVPGHPRIGVTLVQRLTRRDNIAVNVLPGISSFDTMINDLGRDPLEKGSLVIDANRMLLFDMIWPSNVDCYLYHVCSVGTQKVHLRDAQKDNSWDLLKQHLLKIYGPAAIVHLISSSTKENQSSQQYSASLSDLETLKSRVHFGTTLFIEAEKPKKLNRNFLAKLTNGYSNETL